MIEAIRNYILFLKRECDLAVTLHPIHNDPLIIPGELMAFNIHENSYCILLKTCKEAQQHCIDRQGKVAARCEKGSYCGVCYAGVREYVYPIRGKERLWGFISVSGYQTEDAKGYLKAVSEEYALPYEELRSAYRALKAKIPPKERVDTLLAPLCAMLELAYLQREDQPEGERDFCARLVHYLKKNHTREITSKEICEEFSCSRSYMSHKFNQKMGMSIRAYINRLRIEDAKRLLLHSELSITELAYLLGYGDVNYFAVTFKKTVGCSPSQYRKEKRSY